MAATERVFVGSEPELAALLASGPPADDRCLALDMKTLVTIGTLVSGEPRKDVAIELGTVAPAASAGDDGPWILRVPDRLTARFATLSGDRAAEVAERWRRDTLDASAARALPPRSRIRAEDLKWIVIPVVLIAFAAGGWKWAAAVVVLGALGLVALAARKQRPRKEEPGVAETVRSLGALALEAEASGRGLYLWQSL